MLTICLKRLTNNLKSTVRSTLDLNGLPCTPRRGLLVICTGTGPQLFCGHMQTSAHAAKWPNNYKHTTFVRIRCIRLCDKNTNICIRSHCICHMYAATHCYVQRRKSLFAGLGRASWMLRERISFRSFVCRLESRDFVLARFVSKCSFGCQRRCCGRSVGGSWAS